MAFDLSFGAQYLMTTNSSTNRGNENGATTGLKTAGNLPITTNGAQMTNSQGSSLTGIPERIYFGLTSQNSTGGFDTSGGNNMVVLTSVQFNAPNRIQVSTRANEGVSFTVVSGTTETNYKRWFIGGHDTPFGSAQAGPNTMCIDCNADGADATGGTFDNTDFSGWGYGTVRFNLQGSSTNLQFFQRVWLFTTTKSSARIPSFTGAGADWDDAFNEVQGSDYTDKIGAWITKAGNSYFVPCPFQFGDGSTATTFNDNGAVVASPADAATGFENFQLTTNSMRVYLNQRNNAADSVTLTGVYDWGTAAPWDFDEDNLATCTITGATFNGMGDFTVGGSVTGAATFNLASGSDVIINGANLNGSVINGDLRIESDTDLTDITVNGNVVVDIGANATLDFTNVQISGSIQNDSASNTLTVNALGGSTVGSVADAGTGNGQTNYVASVTITLTGVDTNTETRLYSGTLANATSATELDGVEDSSGDVDLVYDAAGAGYIVLIKEDQVPQYIIFGTLPTSDTTIPVDQSLDRVYFNPA